MVLAYLRMADVAHGFLRGKHLVVFGAGYVGGAVAAQALAAGARVTALTRNRERAAALAEGGAQTVVADLADEPAWRPRIAHDADYVLNSVSSAGGGIDGYRRSYVEGLRAILTWGAAGAAPGCLVYTSSTSVYPQDGGVRVDETADTGGADERAEVLLEAERLTRSWPGRSVVLRLAGIYGPNRHHLLDQLRAGVPAMPGRGDHRLNLIHRDDAVAAIFAAFADPPRAAGQTFNVADDGAVPKAELVGWLAARLNCPAPAFTGVAVPGRRAATPDRIIDNRKLKRVLGWRPRYPTWREGYGPLLEPLR